MKKLSVTLFILTGALLACASTLSAKNSSAVNTPAGMHQHEISSEKLVLNNGAKWKVDRTTNSNVDNLKHIFKGFNNNTDRSLKAYKKAGADLQNGLAKMIKECRMQGPDHLALHKWLEPFMAQV
jgi:Spy/CpxP family protein refolding chaperone